MSLAEAIGIAYLAHQGQLDKADLPYIDHPLRVMGRVVGEPAKMVAVLHDVMEDTDWRKVEGVDVEQEGVEGLSEAARILGWIDLLDKRGCPDEVVQAVVAMSRGEKEQPEAYYGRVAANSLALVVKYADLADNADPLRLALLPEATQVRLTKKYEKAHRLLEELQGQEELGQTL